MEASVGITLQYQQDDLWPLGHVCLCTVQACRLHTSRVARFSHAEGVYFQARVKTRFACLITAAAPPSQRYNETSNTSTCSFHLMEDSSFFSLPPVCRPLPHYSSSIMWGVCPALLNYFIQEDDKLILWLTLRHLNRQEYHEAIIILACVL